MHEYEERLGDLISSYLSKQASGGSNKRKRLQQTPTQKGPGGPQSLPRQAELVLVSEILHSTFYLGKKQN